MASRAESKMQVSGGDGDLSVENKSTGCGAAAYKSGVNFLNKHLILNLDLKAKQMKQLTDSN